MNKEDEREVLCEAISVLCNTYVTSYQGRAARSGVLSGARMPVSHFMYAAMGRYRNGAGLIIDEEEFLAPEYDHDFTGVIDRKVFYRGGEVYERPCGWKRYALKVLDKYQDGNTWLGERGHWTSTASMPGEWPVSYHGTSEKGAHGIIVSYYQAGSRDKFGRGVYSTPYIAVAKAYTKTFTSQVNGKKYSVVMQNRVNPQYRQKCNNDRYWLVPVPQGTSPQQEQEIVEKAIRPYALLMKCQ